MLLRSYLLPKYYYTLQHQKVSVGVLRSMDRAVRAAVRKMLHLPEDTPVPMFHEQLVSEGLGIPELETSVINLGQVAKDKLVARGGLWEQIA